MSDTTNDAAFEDAYRSGALLREALRNMGQANHDEGPPLWRGLVTATIPPDDPMNKPTERAPLLSDRDLRSQIGVPLNDADMDRECEGQYEAAKSVRNAYEAKITSGELIPRKLLDGCAILPNVKEDSLLTSYGETWRRVKTCHHIRVELGAGVSTICSSCKEDRYWDVHMNFCPGCGASITK